MLLVMVERAEWLVECLVGCAVDAVRGLTDVLRNAYAT